MNFCETLLWTSFYCLCAAITGLSVYEEPSQLRSLSRRYETYHDGEKSLHDFSFDLFNAVHQLKRRGNLIISPLSVYTALIMLRPALSGSSRSQMERALGPRKLKNKLLGRMLYAIYNVTEYELHQANRVYVDQTIRPSILYRRALKRLKVEGIKNTNFSSNPSQSRKDINNFVAQRTNNIIQNLLPSSAISSRTRLVLINALYLQANWKDRFSSENTINEPFYLANNRTIMVPTMHEQSMRCTIHRDTNYNADVTVLSLGDNLSMLIMMPNKAGNFSTLFDDETDTTKNKFKNMFDSIWPTENRQDRFVNFCNVKLPKFNIQYKTNLKEALKMMGVRDIFNQSDANLSKLQGRNGRAPLYVDQMRHKVVMTANEKGVTGAAATSAHVDLIRSQGRPVQINKPFLFVIRQDLTGAILFAGRVTRPRTT